MSIGEEIRKSWSWDLGSVILSDLFLSPSHRLSDGDDSMALQEKSPKCGHPSVWEEEIFSAVLVLPLTRLLTILRPDFPSLL